jgi:hypothetical protein
MNHAVRQKKQKKTIDFAELGYETMLACGDETRAKHICALDLRAYADQLQPELAGLNAEITEKKHQGGALHAHLYDRPVPVNDAAMLSHSQRIRILLVLSLLTAMACLTGNTTTFYLLGWGIFLTLLAAAGMTALPAAVGHLAYEKIVASHRGLQTAVIVTAVILCFAGLYQLADARRMMVDRATVTPATTSFVDGGPADGSIGQEAKPQEGAESKIHGTLGGAMLLLTIAAELMLGLLAGLLTKAQADEDFAAWRTLKRTGEVVIALETKVSELLSSIEIAEKRCMAGILRAQNVWSKRRPPYHRALMAFTLLVLCTGRWSEAQMIEHHEGMLIDVSGSISKGGTTNDLFHQYLVATKKLLLTEPASSRVWVSSISSDSFGGIREVVKGWTPDARGVFTDDLDRARHQLATSFERNSSGMSPVAAGTDIFGGLWHLKAVFESNQKSTQGASKAIWIFSDMMNETREFPMPSLLASGPEQMLERVKANGLLVPLNGYKIHIYGASPSGLTPQMWMTVKGFWTAYFSAAGAELVSYSAECDVER